MAEVLPVLCLALFIISDMSIPPPPPPTLALTAGGGFPGFPGFIVVALVCFIGFWRLLLGWFLVRDVAMARVGMGGTLDGGRGGALWAGLGNEGMGVEGRGGGEMGASLKAESGRSSYISSTASSASSSSSYSSWSGSAISLSLDSRKSKHRCNPIV